MVTINTSFKVNKFDAMSPTKKILIAVVSVSVLIAAIIILGQNLGWFGQFKEGDKDNQKIVIPSVVYNLAGPIQEIKEKYFVMEASVFTLDLSGKLVQKKEIRKINIVSDTKFSRLTFVAQPGSSAKSPVETPMTFSDIKVGDYIEVIANKDISKAQEFEASQVRALPRNF